MPSSLHQDCYPLYPRIYPSRICEIVATYTWQFNAAVTTFWRSTGFLDVKVSKLAAWGLDDSDLVGGGIVSK